MNPAVEPDPTRFPDRPLRLGTRASALARWQANWVADQLQQAGVEVELVLITTAGDAEQKTSIATIGLQGVFTKALEQALLVGEIDLAVHSLKDLPSEDTPGLALAAVPTRASTSDALIAPPGTTLAGLPHGAKVGTGSLRRKAQLLHARPDLQIEGIRGNVDTRLRKLDEGEFAAIILAEAGLARLGLADRIAARLSPDPLLPAVGQGALGLQCRADDAATREALRKLDDEATHQAVLAERAMLARLRGGCSAPVAGSAHLLNGQLHLEGHVLSHDGVTRLVAKLSDSPSQAIALGQRVAHLLIQQGATQLIAAARNADKA